MWAEVLSKSKTTEFSTINNVYSFSKAIRKWNLHYFCQCVAEKNPVAALEFGATAMSCAKRPTVLLTISANANTGQEVNNVLWKSYFIMVLLGK